MIFRTEGTSSAAPALSFVMPECLAIVTSKWGWNIRFMREFHETDVEILARWFIFAKTKNHGCRWGKFSFLFDLNASNSNSFSLMSNCIIAK
jgi:hypothetical protein